MAGDFCAALLLLTPLLTAIWFLTTPGGSGPPLLRGRADGVVGLFVPPPKADEQIIALYFHGNADQITWGGAMIANALRSRGIGTFAAEYPGYRLSAVSYTHLRAHETPEQIVCPHNL